MVKRVIQELIDDIDGKPADESITFALDGTQYEIDLSKKNAQRLRDALAPFLAAGTKVSRGGGVASRNAVYAGDRHAPTGSRTGPSVNGPCPAGSRYLIGAESNRTSSIATTPKPVAAKLHPPRPAN
jgi:hypothetical protein